VCGLRACYTLLIASWPLQTICTMMEQTSTYVMDLPKRDCTLPEAASERDLCSPHHPHCLLCHSNSLLHCHQQDTTAPGLDSRLLPTMCGHAASHPLYTHLRQTRPALSLTTQIVHVTTRRPVIVDRIRPVPSHGATCG
jgi:hypothetical protein